MSKNEFYNSPLKKWGWYSKFWYSLYLVFAVWLPESRRLNFAKQLRNYFARKVSSGISVTANIEKGAHFNPNVCVGNRSSIGINSELDGPVWIGNDVMMGPEVVVYTRNHCHDNRDIPMIEQGYEDYKPVIIEDDVWIGRRVIILPGVVIGKGSICGAGAVITKSVEEYSVVAGIPAKIIGKR